MSKEESVFDMRAGDSVPDWSGRKKPPAKPAPGTPAQKPQSKSQPGRSTPLPSSQSSNAPSRSAPTPAPQQSGQWQPTYHDTSPGANKTSPPQQRSSQPAGLPSQVPSGGMPKKSLPSNPQQPRLPATPSLPVTPPVTPAPAPAPVPAPAPAPAPTQAYAPTQESPSQQGYDSQPAPPGAAPTPEQIQQEWGVPNIPPQRTPSRPSYDDDIDFDDDEEDSPRARSKSSSRKKGTSKSKGKKRRKKGEGKDYDPGNKTRASILRWVTLGLLSALVLNGVYSSVFPPTFPSDEELVNSVQTELNVTKFPAERAEAFVIGFTKAYLTVSSGSAGGQRQAELSNYVPGKLVESMGSNTANVEQYVVDGPYISGVRYRTNEDAVFTVASRLNSGYWMYLEVPVYYNPENMAFAVSGAPAITAQPRLTSIPSQESWEEDRTDGLAEEVSTYLEGYFEAWSNPEEPERLPQLFTTVAATPKAVTPIQGVEFVSLSNVSVSTLQRGNDTRIARVTVKWKVDSASSLVESAEETEESDENSRPVMYDMTYEVLLVRAPSEETQWRVEDILGGIRTNSAVRGGEEDTSGSE